MVLLTEIYSRIKLASILIVIAYFVIASSKSSKRSKRVKVKFGPTGMSHEESTNCSEFSKYGRFNPYSVIHEKWFVFYYWAPLRSLTTYVFTAPSSNHTRKLKKLFEGNCVLPVQWDVRQLLMEDNRKFISLLVERSDRGEYWLYPVARVRKGQKITPRDIRLKQTGDNRLLGLLDCVDDTLIVMSRLNDVPRKGRLHEEASRLGYRGTKGKSYLYQGHEWGPVDEADEDFFWDRRNENTISKDTSTEDKRSEESSEEAEQPTNKPEHRKAKKQKPKKGSVLAPRIPEDDETCVKVMPELWNDPKPNPNSNPDNLLTKEDINNLDSLIIHDTLAIEGPDASTDIKQESNMAIEGSDGSTDNKQVSIVDMKSENLPENDKLHNHNDAHKMETPHSTDNKSESNKDKESENPPENRKLHNHNDVHKMETPESTDKKPESNINEEPENQPKKDNPHNHKVCPGTTEPDEDDENCVVCYKSHLNYVSDESYVPDSARSMPDLKDNEDTPPQEEPHVDVPRFKIGGIELPLEQQPLPEVRIPQIPSPKTPRTEVLTPKVPSDKTPRTEVPTPKVPFDKTLRTEVPALKVPRIKTSRAKVPDAKVPPRSSAPPPQDQTNSSEIIYLTPRTLDDLKS